MALSFKQRLLRKLYPYFKKMGAKKYGQIIYNRDNIQPNAPLKFMTWEDKAGHKHAFDEYKGKKVLIVNTASNCGFTAQYEELQALYEQFNGTLEIIAFPANDFAKQERGNDQQISQFCQVNFGVTFPIAKKGCVKGKKRQPLYQWLTDKKQNGWNSQEPQWNFSKYLINEQGVLTHYFGPSVSPTAPKFIATIKG